MIMQGLRYPEIPGLNDLLYKDALCLLIVSKIMEQLRMQVGKPDCLHWNSGHLADLGQVTYLCASVSSSVSWGC